MKKKLIKQYRFKQNDQEIHCCFKVVNGNLVEYNEGLQELYIFNNDIGAGDPMSGTDQHRIEGIIAKVLDVTGIDLTQTKKPTKRQEIATLNKEVEALKDCIAEIGEEKHRTWERLAVLEAKTKGLNLEFQFDDNKADAKPTIIEESVFEHGTGESRKVSLHGAKEEEKPCMKYATIVGTDPRYPLGIGDRVEVLGESNMGATVRRLDRNLTYWLKYDDLKFDEVTEEKKPFEVDDLVVLNPAKDFEVEGINDARTAQVHLTIKKLHGNHCSLLWGDKPFYASLLFSKDELLHAPSAPKEKALVFGGSAEITKGCPSKSNYCKGQKVLIIGTPDKEGCEVIMKDNSSVYVLNAHLKAL